MAEIALEHLRGLSHLDVSALDGRAIPFHSLHDDQGWHLWIPDGERVIHIDNCVPIEACYFAERLASESDFHFLFLELLHQRAFWKDIAHFADGLYADIQNIGASLSKLSVLFRHARESGGGAERMAVTEIEYVFLTCRSIFDLLQEVLVALWSKVRLFDKGSKTTKLPATYRKMVLCNEKPLSGDEIASRYGLPGEVAGIYASSAPFFTWLRAYRDLISHSGHTPETVLVGEKGFVITKGNRPFRDMDIWCDANSLPNELGSVLSVIGHVVGTTFATCDAFADALPKVIDFPRPVAPRHRMFVRGPHIQNLTKLSEIVRERPWHE